ncbi:MAG TPA: transposase [Candidatus Nitrosocosmicus sp.]
MPRPVDKQRKKRYYSGKKKRDTVVKTQLMVNNRGYILHKVAHKKGKRHDYNIYKENHPVIPKQVVTVVDLGYLDMEKDFPEQLSALPFKKKRN